MRARLTEMQDFGARSRLRLPRLVLSVQTSPRPESHRWVPSSPEAATDHPRLTDGLAPAPAPAQSSGAPTYARTSCTAQLFPSGSVK